MVARDGNQVCTRRHSWTTLGNDQGLYGITEVFYVQRGEDDVMWGGEASGVFNDLYY